MTDKPKQIQYVPPSAETLRDFARAVCESLAQQRDDPSLASHEVISGLANFLQVITRIQAKHLSTVGEWLDDDDE